MSHLSLCHNPACRKPFLTHDRLSQYCSRACWHQVMREQISFAERFWAKVAICAHGIDCPFCCHEWTAYRDKAGYGIVGTNIKGPRRSSKASRRAWELVNNRLIPDGLFALHHCDNPPCVNLHHIYLGTKMDNAKDAQARGRLAKGERRSPLLARDVLLLQDLYRQGHTLDALAAIFGITADAIGSILRGETWKHLPAAIPAEEYTTTRWAHHPRGNAHKNALLTEDDVRQIRLLYPEGGNMYALARQFGVSATQIHAVIHRNAWKHVP